ncbi:transmembrane protein 250-like [Ylistrum balloti]|uniref:transmembrane protein 250-like n=1 Tax=Ylistrum balloti TaxID=509963 RepID=UPI002905C78F|nr:transmembrane protein 250-like [Ylistrum balloti]
MFLLPVRAKTFQGPRMTCIMTAETFNVIHFTASSYQGTQISGSLYHRTAISTFHRIAYRLMMGLMSMLLFAVMCVIFAVCYVSVHMFLRFQISFTVILVNVRRQPINFRYANSYSLLFLHIILMCVGGFGYICLIYVDI